MTEMKLWYLGMFAVLLGGLLGQGAGELPADSVLMKDGWLRRGTVVRQTADEVELRLEYEGITASVVLSKKDIEKVTIGAAGSAPKVSAATLPSPAATAPAAATQAAATRMSLLDDRMAVLELPKTRGFLTELGATALGDGPDNPDRLPEELRKLWDAAQRSDGLGRRGETLDGLRALDDAFMPLAGGMARLEGVCRRERGEGFGVWMGRVHWDVISASYPGGVFDLRDVREEERKALIGFMKEKMAGALEALKGYFPPVDEKTGKAAEFRPSQLQGIVVGNALEVKGQAAFASALLLGQLKLEPGMPAVDRRLLMEELVTVRRIFSRALELEPAAKAAAEKAAREQRAAEEKAKRAVKNQ
jgi:hypothetical protein